MNADASRADIKRPAVSARLGWIVPAKVDRCSSLALLPVRAAGLRCVVTDRLGANPAEFITRSTGDWTLRFLCITLAVTPLRGLTGWNVAAQAAPHAGAVRVLLRRAALHQLHLVRPWSSTSRRSSKDIVKRPFITVGFIAFVLLIPLAATCTNAHGAAAWAASAGSGCTG